MSETPQVTQSKLNIAHNEVSEVSPNDLQPHPKNREIYGDTEDPSELGDEFVESVESKGVLEPLTVTNSGEIVSGHRRWLAAKEAGLATIPVRREDFESDLHEREALIEFNRQREKTPGQIVNEFEEMLAVERERAKERMKAQGNQHEGKEKFPDHQTGQARDKAAEKVNADVSGRTLKKGKKVKDKADDEDEPEPVREAAQEAWEGLESGEESFNSAHKKVKEAEDKKQKREQRNVVKETIESTTPNKTTKDVSKGDVWMLGNSRLFCGDSSTKAFKDILPDTTEAFAFCDPPYGANAAEWDGSFVWNHDYLIETAETVAVTPGIESIPNLMRRTDMPYRWSVSAWIDNGMTRGALGFGNWIYMALFSRAESIHKNSQDMVRISVSTDDNRPEHKGRKPVELVEWFFDRFVTEETTAIIDPFSGSGTTLLTAEEMTDTPVYAAEINPEFCGEIISAWEKQTDNVAELKND